ncbi:uncharacterized protein LOC125257118 isoform X1 [Megalobrama amblycephala]|uniref:uncharacterized protein LOC125257118 isoform X1 n=1 Tax=Megalobrama amblycephala TaxID=75352 RepID=UPI002013DA8F|nr:uncharacterized protein LOC125257118 isoform X1 [Megalobrama amblycephala]
MLMADTCSVVGCKAQKGQMVSLHILPNDQKLRSKWVQFIGNNCNVPAKLPSRTYVCSRHFPENCFENFIMTKLGFASKLILKPNAIPSIYSEDTASTNHRAEDVPPMTREVGCQCNAPVLKSVAVQAVLTQKKPKRRSKAIQVKPLVSNCASVSCSDEDFPVKSESSFTLTPIKRPRMEDSSEGTSYSSEEPTDDTHVPDLIQEEDIKLEPCDSSYIVVTI